MKMWTVLGRSLARSRALFFGLACVLGGFQFLLVIMAGEVHQSQAFSQLTALVPPMIQQALGGLAFTSFPALVSFGYSHPIVVLALVEAAIFVGSEPAWEVEAGVLDLSMARPVPRRMMIARSALVVILTTAALATCMATATRIALHAFAPAGAPWPPVAVTVTLALNLGTVALCFGCLSLAAASIASRRGAVLGTTGLAAIVLYLLNVVAQLWSPARRVVWTSPFHYYDAMAIVAGTATQWPRDAAVLAAVSVASCAAAFVMYSRRDL
ncbi:MAG: hypothetical protein DMF86_11860 [Acidobacteria bacterium]|nr:MAG: hypothetical protein DMF86_11860 [Acidobacteriota bacterium]